LLVLVLASIEVGAVGIVVGGLATVGVAVITAVTTNRRQRESLRHDRELVDLADLRTLLDEAAIALDRAGSVREDVEAAFALSGFAMPDEKKQALGEHFSQLAELNARLNLRLGVEDLVAVHFEEANDALYFILEALYPEEDASPQAVEQSRQKILEYGAKSAGHTGAFFTAAFNRAGTIQRQDDSDGVAAAAERRAALLAEVTRLASPLRPLR
jgi:hypothetical protein